MRTVWSCSSCALLLFFALLGRETSASHAGRQWKDVHRIPKAQVTAPPLRRDEGTCPAEHSSCPASLSGGCCPSRYACAVDSCYATTAGPTTACNKAGYFACAAVDGGGCCPVGYVCGKGSCIPPAGVSDTYLQCPTDYFLCPSTLNYGCCKSGMGCARSACYSTEPVTTTVIQTVTTTSGSETITTIKTAVTVAIPTPPSGLPTDGTDVAAKFIPTSVPKVPVASPTNEPGGGGLSGGAIGGIIAGVVALLVVVVVAAFLIIRRLKHVEEIMESKQGSSSGKKSRSQSQAQMDHYGRQLHSHADMDDMSVDPLMTSSNTHNNSIAGTPQPGTNASRARSDSAGFTPSPNMFNSAHPPYASPDSSLGYFDVIPGGVAASQQQQQQQQQQQPMTTRMRSSTASTAATTTTTNQQHRGYAHHHHWRHQSNASELSADGSDNGANASVFSPLVGGAGGGSVGGPAELDASRGYAELPDYGSSPHDQHHGGVRSRSSSAASVRGHGYGHVRTRSDGVQGQGQQSPPGGVPGGPATSGPGLTPLDETAEMHGYYGGRNQQAGQTAAGLVDL